MDEQKLVKKAMDGNRAAFEKLFILMEDQMYRTAFLYMGNQADALDVVQETAYRALKNIHSLKHERYFKTWLMRIVMNSALDLLGKRKPLMQLEDCDEPVAKNQMSAEKIDLVTAVSQLKVDYKEVIILHYYQDLKVAEIAKILNLPEGTVKTYLARGREALKKNLGGVSFYDQAILPRGI